MSGFLSDALGRLQAAAGGMQTGAGGDLARSAFDEAGGTNGVIARAEQAGLGEKVRSWIGTGGNIPLLVEEVTKIFPPEQIERFAAQHGVPAGLATQILAQILPHAVDQQTPDGTAAAAEPAGEGFDFGALASKIFGSK